jgi:hypothetical protein
MSKLFKGHDRRALSIFPVQCYLHVLSHLILWQFWHNICLNLEIILTECKSDFSISAHSWRVGSQYLLYQWRGIQLKVTGTSVKALHNAERGSPVRLTHQQALRQMGWGLVNSEALCRCQVLRVSSTLVFTLVWAIHGLRGVPPQNKCWILSPTSSECDITWRKDLYRGDDIKIKS